MTAVIFQRWLKQSSAMLSTDFCPSANRWVYWLKNPFWIVVLAAVGSAACGFMVNPWIFALTGLLSLVAALGIGLPWVAMRGISCRVTFDVRRVRFGEVAMVRLRIRNRWPLPVWGLSLINGFATSTPGNVLPDGDEGIAFARVPGWSTIEYSWAFTPRQRGLYPVDGHVEVETSFPFGLFRARKTADVEGSLVVWPETVTLQNMPDAAESQLMEDSFSERRVGDFGDMLGTRPFREGDSLRRVHWAQTARQQTLIVTERQAPMTNSIRVVLDLSPQSHPIATRATTVEQCIRVAASVCDSLHRQHCRVELQIFNDLLVAGQNAAGLQRVMDALAVVSVCDADDSSLTEIKRGRAFQITITTPHGLRQERPHQIVIASRTVERTNAREATGSHFPKGGTGTAWIDVDSQTPLNQFATDWRKALS